MRRPIVLTILDGWGYSTKSFGNPIKEANTPEMDYIEKNYPMTLLQASGLAVGMVWGEIGNSEVGHLNIGAGRIIEQYMSRITRAIANDDFFKNQALVGAFQHASKNKSKVHILGLLTSGTVHASIDHLLALIELAAQNKHTETYLHLFLDGKDSGLHEAPELLARVKDKIKNSGYCKLASFIGRNFAMDRDNNWDRTQKSYDLFVSGIGENTDDYLSTIKNYYDKKVNDSSIPPIVAKGVFAGINSDDALIFFNFREDSMRQILRPFIEEKLEFFPRVNLQNLYICTMTEYIASTAVSIAFPRPDIKNSLVEVVSTSGKNQLHVAETEKYAHVTYFFNGLRTEAYPGETDIFIKSDTDHELQPEMKCAEIANKIITAIKEDLYDFYVINLANADVLAHTGNYAATLVAVEAVDKIVGLIKKAVLENDGAMIITADHGNAESLIYKTGGERESKHDQSPVPFYLIGNQYQTKKDQGTITRETRDVSGILADVAPTIIELMNLPKPPEMTGQSLLSILLANKQ